jgi:hypothetical protein
MLEHLDYVESMIKGFRVTDLDINRIWFQKAIKVLPNDKMMTKRNTGGKEVSFALKSGKS